MKWPSSKLCTSQFSDNSPTSSNLSLTITLVGRAYLYIITFLKKAGVQSDSGHGPQGCPSQGRVEALFQVCHSEAKFFPSHCSSQEMSPLECPGALHMPLAQLGQFALWPEYKIQAAVPRWGVWMRVGRSWHKPIPAPGKGSKSWG